MIKYLVLIFAMLVTGCSQQVVTRTEFVKLQVTDPGDPLPPEKCKPANLILMEYKGEKLVAESLSNKLDRLKCDRDKVRYVNELKNTITYYREVTK